LHEAGSDRSGEGSGENLLQTDQQTAATGPKSPPLERYFRILETLGAFPEGLSLKELSDLLVLPKQSAHRLLATMQESGLVQTSSGRGQTYSLGDRVRRLALLGADEGVVRTLTSSLLQRLSAELGETCYIAKLEGTTVRSVAMQSPDTPWRGFVLPGKILQPHATAAGKTIMAYQSEEVVAGVLSGPLSKISPRTITSKAAVRSDFERIRARGYGTCIGEIDEALAAIAVPIEVNGVGVIYGLGIVGPLPRITRLIDGGVAATLQNFGRAIAAALSKGSPNALAAA
jgi:DNA-binding IclR family transcriptional regulator